jgi:beta-phosphoglucomutase-like phosphatase (HAD superfamily)
MNKISAVIFDFDGTLVDTEKCYAIAFAYTAEELGLDKGAWFYCCNLGGIRWGEQKNLLLQFFPDIDINYYEECFHRNIDRVFAELGVARKAGVAEVLDYIKSKNLKIGIASMSKKETIEDSCIKAGIDMSKIDYIFGGDDIKNAKPNPEVYLRSMEKLEVSPSETIIVEDSLVGAIAGISSGARTVIVCDVQPIPREVADKAYCVFEKNCLIKLKTLL